MGRVIRCETRQRDDSTTNFWPSRAMKRLGVAQNGRQTAAIYSHSSLLYSVGILGGTTARDS